MTACLMPDKFAIINEEERACLHEIHSAKTREVTQYRLSGCVLSLPSTLPPSAIVWQLLNRMQTYSIRSQASLDKYDADI